MTKKRTRENLYIMLFQANFHGKGDLSEQIELYLEQLEDADATEKAKTALRKRFGEMYKKFEDIDKIIAEKAKGWEVSRLAKSDLTILRLAVFEILYDEDVPNSVAINEAVELAKKYGTDKSYRFVNGVLASVAKEAEQKAGEENAGNNHSITD